MNHFNLITATLLICFFTTACGPNNPYTDKKIDTDADLELALKIQESIDRSDSPPVPMEQPVFENLRDRMLLGYSYRYPELEDQVVLNSYYLTEDQLDTIFVDFVERQDARYDIMGFLLVSLPSYNGITTRFISLLEHEDDYVRGFAYYALGEFQEEDPNSDMPNKCAAFKGLVFALDDVGSSQFGASNHTVAAEALYILSDSQECITAEVVNHLLYLSTVEVPGYPFPESIQDDAMFILGLISFDGMPQQCNVQSLFLDYMESVNYNSQFSQPHLLGISLSQTIEDGFSRIVMDCSSP